MRTPSAFGISPKSDMRIRLDNDLSVIGFWGEEETAGRE